MGRRRATTPPAFMPSLIGPDDLPPVELIESGAAPVLLTCDHASNAVPRALKGLGLASEALAQHIGWDIGAAAVTRRLAAALAAPAVLSGYSRLVIDCNRDPSDMSSIPETSDGIAIPGNRGLSREARDGRRRACFEPYHARIAAWLAAAAAAA
ncbi:MAG TPA: N-formylglutamate amidohydrolase, partial [Stellaceae bacterium]|nr:N-formylglutamate amidohydrolase [Stellaceae bacterium]